MSERVQCSSLLGDTLESIYSAINDENYELFKEKYAGLEQKIKYCHDILSEAAQGKSIQSTSIIDHILNKEKVPVSIRTLQNAFVTAIDNNIESALAIYKYSDENLHGEAHFNTIRGFLSHALNTLPDNEAEKFINISSIRAFDDAVIFKEMIRAEKYTQLGYTTEIEKPYAKDWNDELLNIQLVERVTKERKEQEAKAVKLPQDNVIDFEKEMQDRSENKRNDNTSVEEYDVYDEEIVQ